MRPEPHSKIVPRDLSRGCHSTMANMSIRFLEFIFSFSSPFLTSLRVRGNGNIADGRVGASHRLRKKRKKANKRESNDSHGHCTHFRLSSLESLSTAAAPCHPSFSINVISVLASLSSRKRFRFLEFERKSVEAGIFRLQWNCRQQKSRRRQLTFKLVRLTDPFTELEHRHGYQIVRVYVLSHHINILEINSCACVPSMNSLLWLLKQQRSRVCVFAVHTNWTSKTTTAPSIK